jgi:hypothetical protein
VLRGRIFPNTVVWFLPTQQDIFRQPFEQFHEFWTEFSPGMPEIIKCLEQMAIIVELELACRPVADANRLRSAVIR